MDASAPAPGGAGNERIPRSSSASLRDPEDVGKSMQSNPRRAAVPGAGQFRVPPFEGIVQQQRLRVAEPEQPRDFLRPEVAFQRDGGGADSLDRQIRHAPFRRVLPDQTQVVAGTEAFRRQERRRPQHALPEVGVGVALFPPAAADPHGHPAGVVLGAGFEQFDDGAVGVHPARLASLLGPFLVVQRREDPALETRQVDMQPVVVPVDSFGIEEEPSVVAVEPLEEIPCVVRPEDEPVSGDEGLEGVVLPLALLDEALERLDIPAEAVHDADERPDRLLAGPIENLRQPRGRPSHPLQGVRFETVGADGSRLHPPEHLVPQLHPGRLVAEVAALVDAHQVHDPPDSRRIPVPARHLIDEPRLGDDGLRGNREGGGSHHVHGHHIQNQVRIHRKQVLAPERHPHERRAGGESLVPAGVGKRDGALDDGGPDDRPRHPVFAGDELISQALGVGVDVRPAPPLGLLDPEVAQPPPDPLLPLAGDGEGQLAVIVGIPALLGKAPPRPFPEAVHPRLVLGFVADSRRQAITVLDLPFHPKFLVLAVASREVPEERFVFVDLPGTVPGDETGADVDERGALHPPGEGDGVAGAVHIRGDGGFERRIEIHPAGTVQDEVNVRCDRRGAIPGITEVLARDVAAEDDDLLVQKIPQTGPVARPEAREGRGVLHQVVEAGAALRFAGGPDHQVDPANFREELEQHPEADLAEKSGAAEQQDAPAGKRLAEVDPRSRLLAGHRLRTPRGS